MLGTIKSINIGGLNRFGVELKAPISSSVIEGSAGVSFLRNTVPLTPGFKPELNSAEVVAEAESILAPAQVPAVFENSLIDINLIHLLEVPKQPYRERVFQQAALVIVLAHTILPIHPEGEEAHPSHITGPKIAIEKVVKPQIHLESILRSEPVSLAALAHPIEVVKHKEEHETEEKEVDRGIVEQEHIETIVKPALVEDTEKIIKREHELEGAIEEVAFEADPDLIGVDRFKYQG